MIRDNNWHAAICVKLKDGTFGIFDDQKEAVEIVKDKLPTQARYQDVKYNWNKGQPIVDFGNFKMSIVVEIGK